MAAIPPAATVPAAVAAAPIFALFPGRATNNFLNFSSSDDVTLYKAAVAPMTTLYNLAPIGLPQFLSNVADWCLEYGMEGLITIPTAPGAIDINLITHHGMVTMQDCQVHALTYIATQTCAAQNLLMLYTFLSKSLTEDARMLIYAFKDEFTLTAPAPVNLSLAVGTMFLKTIISKSIVDSHATIDTLRNSISTLDSKMLDLQSNIMQFNLHVINVRNGLLARGETVPELLSNLYKAYGKASDEEFVDYIKMKKFAHFDGTTNKTAESLMAKALAHYEASMERGTWSAPNPKDAKIIALTAENAKLKKGKASTTSASKTNRDEKIAWRKIKPKSGETTKVVDDLTWNWCVHHKAWVRHSAANCFLNPDKKPDIGAKSTASTASSLTTPSLHLDPALQAVLDDDDDSQQ